MSNYIVSARKYRPVNFDTVVGQPSVTNTLKNAIKAGHVAHAYLFCGPRGVGKTTCARIFAKTLNCFHLSPEIEACNQCESCMSFNESRSFNIHELDAASNNSVDDIRSLIDKVRIIPQVGKYSIYIIDEVHMLSQSAFNAFLKTLEEPPSHAVFILATTEKHKIIPTILSRCQIFDFQRIRIEDIVAYLARVARLEGITCEEEALNVIALKADGAMRDALSIFDQVASFSNGNITYHEVLDNLNVLDYEYFFRMTSVFLNGSAGNALVLFNEILQRGFDGQNFISGLASHLRDLLVCRDEATLPLLEVSDVLRSRYREQALLSSNEFLFSALEVCSQCELSFKASRNQRLHVELALIRMASIVSEKKKPGPEDDILPIPDLKRAENGKKPVAQVIEMIPSPVTRPSPVPSPVEKPVVLKESQPVWDTTLPSITDALKGISPNETEPETEPLPDDQDILNPEPDQKQAINMETLILCWNAFAEKIGRDKPRMAATIKGSKPEILENNIIGVELNNGSQLDEFNNSIRSELEKYLQREMCNNGISIRADLIVSQETEQAKLYTSEEKFRYLSQKNPKLETFKQKLNLELE